MEYADIIQVLAMCVNNHFLSYFCVSFHFIHHTTRINLRILAESTRDREKYNFLFHWLCLYGFLAKNLTYFMNYVNQLCSILESREVFIS